MTPLTEPVVFNWLLPPDPANKITSLLQREAVHYYENPNYK